MTLQQLNPHQSGHPTKGITQRNSRRTSFNCVPAIIIWIVFYISTPAHAELPHKCAPTQKTGKGSSPGVILHKERPVHLVGFNIAWFDFAKDFGQGIDEKHYRKALQDARDVGANSLRWWVHTDGSQTPEWRGETNHRRIAGPGKSTIKDLRNALDIAQEYNVVLILSLWSFDMLYNNHYRNPPTHDNYRLLTDEAVLTTYINNALIPMVKALNGHPQLFAWELFNEPENMTESWIQHKPPYYGGPQPTLPQLQKVQAYMSAAIHQTAKDNKQVALVTTGSKSLGKYNSDVSGGYNWYRDDRMMAAANNNPNAVLDFYAPHYYNNEGCDGRWSPFHHPASHWNLDKPIVIGEFYSHKDLMLKNKLVTGKNKCLKLKELGYAGGWSWQWIEYRTNVLACAEKINVEHK